ncbi:transposable element Tcb1 transposase [Trichonephila clavipes]|nr:transposable element Tcb1 transposase [Trichonephila clavipes]
MEAGGSVRRIARQLGLFDCVVRRCLTSGSKRCHLHKDQGLKQPSTDQLFRSPPHRTPESSRTIQRHLAEGQVGSWCPLRVLPLTPTHRHLRLEWCHTRGELTAVEWNQVVFCNESIFNLSSDDNRVRVWRPRGERLNPAFALQRYTAPTAGVMV